MKKLFISIEIVVYLSFILCDLLYIESYLIKYFGIIMCLFFAIYNKDRYKSVAMTFTLIADLFLLVINDYYEIGVFSFIIVQVTYALLIDKIINNKTSSIYIRIIIQTIGLILLALFDLINLLNVFVILYFSNLLVNTLLSYSTKNKLFAIGLTLFVCCDICVGIHNIIQTNNAVSFLIWFFYLPSQVLIVLA